MNNPNLYPYNVFVSKTEDVFVFHPIAILYGNNAFGKTTVLNIIANKLGINGYEYASCNQFGTTV